MPSMQHDRVLDDADIEHFVEQGFVRLDHAFPRETAEATRAILWRDTGCTPDDPSTWTRPVVRLGYYTDPPFVAAANTPRHVVTYGFAAEADVRAEEVSQQGGRMHFALCLPDGSRTVCTLALPGRHNVQNALAAAAVAWQLGVANDAIARALENFEPALRPALKKAGMLTRDARMVERKKVGKHKARRSKQWAKR